MGLGLASPNPNPYPNPNPNPNPDPNSDQMAYTVELVGVRAPPLPGTLCGLQLHLSHVVTSDMDFATQVTLTLTLTLTRTRTRT